MSKRRASIHRQPRVRGASSLLALALAGLAFPAVAQTAESSSDQVDGATTDAQAQMAGEIIVTATRQSQSITRVPLSIVAKDQLTLDKQGMRSMGDLARLTPGISFGQTSLNYGTGQSVISIRGIQSDSGIPTTGIYIDDTPTQTRIGISPSLTNAYPQVFDLDRVEVLRGPQGTLFGSGSVGGAVRFITPEPSFEKISLYGRGELATTDQGAASYEAGLAVGAPLVEGKLGFRASGWYRHDGGYVDRLDRYTKRLVAKDIDGQDSYSARLALGWRPTDNLTLVPSLFFQNITIDDSSRFELATSNRGNADYRTSVSRLPEYHKEHFYLPALKGTLDLGDLTVVSNSSYFWRKTRTRSDDAALSLALMGGWQGADFPAGFDNYQSNTNSVTYQKAFTQEVRLQKSNPNDRFNFVLGLFYQKSVVRDRFVASDPGALQAINFGQAAKGLPPLGAVSDFYPVDLYQGVYSNYQNIAHHDEQKAVFAQVDYEIVPRLKATAGLRYTIADYTYQGFAAGPFNSTDGTSTRQSSRNNTLTPKFGLAFQADRSNLFYVNAAKGVRGSGVAPAVGTICSADAGAIGFDPRRPSVVRPDSIWSYELGSKNRLFGGKVLIDAAAYRVDWKNIQTLFNLPSCSIYTALNFGDAKIDGFDLSLTVAPVRQLSLGASVSYTHARYTSPLVGANNVVVRRAGEPFPVAPWSIQLNGEFTQPIGRREAYLRADFAYTSHDDTPLDLKSPLVDPDLPRAPKTSLLNLRAGLRSGDGIDLSLFVNNVTNSHPILSLYHDVPGSQMYRAASFRPRTIGLTATVRR